MSSSDSSLSVVGISIGYHKQDIKSKRTLLLLLSLLLSGSGTASSGSTSGGSGSGTSGADVGQELLDVLTLEGLIENRLVVRS
jgi:hypothetical protein